MATRMSETIYYVHDLDEAVESYQKNLGFKLIQKQDWGWALLELYGGKVGLLTEAIWKQSGADYEGMPQPKMAFQTDDIDGEVAKLIEAGADVDELKGEPGSMRAVVFRDLCGNEFFLWDDGSELNYA